MTDPKPFSMSDAGKRGGKANVERHPHEHFVAMGRKGAEERKRIREVEAQVIDGEPPRRRRPAMGDEPKLSLTPAEAGKRGGERTLERRGREFYRAIGAMGGAKVREAFAALRKVGKGDGTAP